MSDAFLVATYNIHKGTRGVGLTERLEILNLGLAVEALDADLVFLQEVRAFNHRLARRFRHWPQQAQHEFLAPMGYHSAYVTNAVTRSGEHGNALLSRWPIENIGHHDVSDHRFEQRGLLHVVVRVHGRRLHCVVVHLGLLHSSRVRQVRALLRMIQRDVPADEPVLVAGDFNDWGQRLTNLLHAQGLAPVHPTAHKTFPSRLPMVGLDRMYARGLQALSTQVPRGQPWVRLSDHLPLMAEWQFADSGPA